MKLKHFLLAALATFSACTGTGTLNGIATLSSPDGNLTLDVSLSDRGEAMYSLSYGGKAVVLPSHLGFELRGSVKATELDFSGKGISKKDSRPSYDFSSGFSLLSVATDSLDETWTPVWGEEKSIRNNYNELLVCLQQEGT
ncbi:MAG: glycoside hydrolase family 97 N-terminal domain-containing protein, partial [Candidatus Cryptobacteroides sp.]